MKHNIYRKILLNRESGKKMLAILIDPEKSHGRNFAAIVAALKVSSPDFVFIGGSHAVKSLDSMIGIIKEEVSTDVILFPGDASQFSTQADAMLFLSLLSGRNAEFLIGQHVKSAYSIYQSGMEIIPTAYLLIDGGKVSSVQYISNTLPVPADKKEIALSTALAGELLGMRLTYLEAGSGALNPVPAEMISFVRNNSESPLIVGGGIKSISDMETAFNAGADLIVVGNVLEDNCSEMIEFINWVNEFNSKNSEESKEELP